MTPFRIMLVEDNEADIFFFRESVRDLSNEIEVAVCVHGEEALERLAFSADSRRPLPHLIILDLNLPRMGGLDFLRQFRCHPRFGEVAVIVFSSSAAPADIRDCYASGARAYVVKPMTFEDAREVLRSSIAFWRHALPAPATSYQSLK